MWETNRVSNGHGCCCFYSVSVPEGAVLTEGSLCPRSALAFGTPSARVVGAPQL